MSKKLIDIRDNITRIDAELLSLLVERRKCSQLVADIKRSAKAPLRDQKREKELLESLSKKATAKGLDPYFVTQLFHTIIKDSVRFQQDYLCSEDNPGLVFDGNKRLAVLGGEGAYSHLAAKKFFYRGTNDYVDCVSFEQIIQSVESGEAQFGVIPIENTITGGITEVYDLLLDSDLSIVGEEKYQVEHCLLAKSGTPLNEIQHIFAHPQASRQCDIHLKKLTNTSVSLVQSTAHAVQQVVESSHHQYAAIGSIEAAELFGLDVLLKNIANHTENMTRFLVLASKPAVVSSSIHCKTSIALSTSQKAGSLADVLSLFRDADIPLSKLESRPIPSKPWEQMFYIDFLGNLSEPKIKSTIDQLSELCLHLRVFGCYPTKDIVSTQIAQAKL